MDDFVRNRLPDDVLEKFDEFKEKNTVRPKIPAVYGIYDKKERNCLYIGETDNFISRLDNHFHGGGNDLRDKLKSDDNPAVNPDRIWHETEMKYVIIPDNSTRSAVEDVLKEELNPEYTKQ